MKSRTLKLVTTMCALAMAFAMMPNAQAVCGVSGKMVRPSSWEPGISGLSMAGSARVEYADHESGASIVGMWHVLLTATMSNGEAISPEVIDNALVVWHSDKTEIMNSMRPPQDGNFCMGVWEQTGPNRYYLNHFAWFSNLYPNNTDNGIGIPVGPTHITENVTLSGNGEHYTGTFTLTAYDTTGTAVQVFTGTIAGTRIDVNTTAGSLF